MVGQDFEDFNAGKITALSEDHIKEILAGKHFYQR